MGGSGQIWIWLSFLVFLSFILDWQNKSKGGGYWCSVNRFFLLSPAWFIKSRAVKKCCPCVIFSRVQTLGDGLSPPWSQILSSHGLNLLVTFGHTFYVCSCWEWFYVCQEYNIFYVGYLLFFSMFVHHMAIFFFLHTADIDKNS